MSSRLVLNNFRSIEECLATNPSRISKLLLPSGKQSGRIENLRQKAYELKIPIENNPKPDPEEPVLAILKDYQYADFDELVSQLRGQIQEGKRPIVVMLDGITDPQNLGAIIRTAAVMGISGLILPKDRSVMVTGAAYRVASGGMEHIKIAQVTNLNSALEELKDAGFWSIGFSEHASKALPELERDFPPVIVIGNEEKGLRPLVEKNCDFLVKIKAGGKMQSLNASVAAAIAMYWAQS